MSPIFPQRAQYFCKRILHFCKWSLYSCTWPLYYWKWPICSANSCSDSSSVAQVAAAIAVHTKSNAIYVCVYTYIYIHIYIYVYIYTHKWMHRVAPHVQLRCTHISHTTYERVMSHHMNEAYLITRMSHVTYEYVAHVNMPHINDTRTNAARRTCEDATRVYTQQYREPCHVWMSDVILYEGVMSRNMNHATQMNMPHMYIYTCMAICV